MGAPTNSYFDFARLEVSCTSCGHEHSHPLSELEANSAIACPCCGETTDISSHGWRERVAQESWETQQLKKLNLA